MQKWARLNYQPGLSLYGGARVTGDVAYSGDKTLTIQNAQVGGTVKTDNTASTVNVRNATVQDIDAGNYKLSKKLKI